jgi:hypothetical protein
MKSNIIIKLHIATLCLFFTVGISTSDAQADYGFYHAEIIYIEEMIVAEEFATALSLLEQVFNTYGFVFVREYQLATLLAILQGNQTKAKQYLAQAMKKGMTAKEVKKNKRFRALFNEFSKDEVDAFRQQHEALIDLYLRKEVQEMYKKDQKMAMKSLFRLRRKAKIKYAETKFAPHSEQQLTKLSRIIKTKNYPGELLIGNRYWASTILSHHNAISPAYNEQDKLYMDLQPLLIFALKSGHMQPFEYAIIDNWKIASKSGHSESSYGFLGPTMTKDNLAKANFLRDQIGMRSIELRNQLIDIENKYKIDLYLPDQPWQKGKIKIEN